ncbi:DUF6124 family protein [Pseudomonas typographi]|uniref:DUF3077 domain-containing protein n=1 Tax=Pseudomonas typographi TaxID=2715964 RepID=A0ABR7Z9Z5_9PSED|nr:DUF3077 domain-containing protein [Pseudomonas typographi]MBD1555124.1 DUF3077 domain-containing protein [Pseudomonas typographi]MBD1590158.1 DUF3077 domain-containing protein [Pseudomonas typographi]MBD1602193.1 DUF3077 domain-containing protein [Pseudomonas typographi]
MFPTTSHTAALDVFVARPGTPNRLALAHASHLLACATATAYEAADRYSGGERHAGLSVVHLVELAKVLVDTALENDERNALAET